MEVLINSPTVLGSDVDPDLDQDLVSSREVGSAQKLRKSQTPENLFGNYSRGERFDSFFNKEIDLQKYEKGCNGFVAMFCQILAE